MGCGQDLRRGSAELYPQLHRMACSPRQQGRGKGNGRRPSFGFEPLRAVSPRKEAINCLWRELTHEALNRRNFIKVNITRYHQ
jgi:hypothetical protein